MYGQCMAASSPLHPRRLLRDAEISTTPRTRAIRATIKLSFKSSTSDTCAFSCLQPQWTQLPVSKATTKKYQANLREEPPNSAQKRGTLAGAVALIIGTSIGSGILALPQKTSPAGLLPSSITLITCWAFLLIEALLLVEINVGLLRKREKRAEEDELEVISIRTMAQETLGEWGGTLATVTYVFLGYTSMVAYASKSGEILYHLVNIPESISGFFFSVFFTLLISIGGTHATDQVNQWLTATMIGLLLGIEILAVLLGGLSGMEGASDWGKVPATIPVIIFSLVYHDIAPVVCAYLGGDLPRIRASVLLGSVVPLLALLLWDGIALGLSAQADQVADPVQLFMSVRWSGISFLVEAFSLLAVGTSLLGTLLSFTEFFKEQLNGLSRQSPAGQEPKKLAGPRKWWGRNKVSFTATAMVIAPPLVVSATVPDAFSAATDIAHWTWSKRRELTVRKIVQGIMVEQRC
ncbi:uncharacterized protein LOC127806731 isoform X2 [Diospyros lotus]|uniref:uncharacterized protein LOC127806731 isoform X2 n=1 Tax=Diospyros lotus TaxID=55363 RepID=UPI00224C9D9B|nr:uncharacterized protein LOC127806731 isoform X2 [Diospyros lotus]